MWEREKDTLIKDIRYLIKSQKRKMQEDKFSPLPITYWMWTS